MKKTVLTEKDIIDIIKREKPEISETDLKWRLFHYCKVNALQCIGSRQYVKADAVYDYELGTLAEELNMTLSTEYPDIKIAVWETRILNEWLNLLLAKNTIFIEVEKDFVETIYDALSDLQDNNMILVNPRSDDFFRYQKDGIVVIRTLLSRAPVSKNHHILLEKLFVDLICDKFLMEMFDKTTVDDIIRSASLQYAINEKRVFTYAKRRGKYDEVMNYWGKMNDKQKNIQF